MKIALIIANNIWLSPYVRIYTRLFDNNNVDYSIISWNRDGNDKKEGFQYNEFSNGSASIAAYIRYARFVKSTVLREGFDRLILFGPITSCLLVELLYKYRNRFILDYRDLSIEQKPVFRQIYSMVLKWSYANVISSPGFKKCLPENDYFISHNFDSEHVKCVINQSEHGCFNTGKGINILTIGGIRDYSSNIEIVKALANCQDYTCRFVGKGIASQQIEEYCIENEIHNVSFHGYYHKEDEPSFIKDATLLNIFYPRKITHDTAMSNRFYNSLLYKRPMIVTKGTTQGDFVEKYNVGVSINDCSDLQHRIASFLAEDYNQYAERCNYLLGIFLKDDRSFKEKVLAFVR